MTSLEAEMSRASAPTTARVAALLLGLTFVSAPRADDQAGTQPLSPSASPIPEDGQSDRPDGAGARPSESPRLRSVRRPFLLLWKDGRDESEVRDGYRSPDGGPAGDRLSPLLVGHQRPKLGGHAGLLRQPGSLP